MKLSSALASVLNIETWFDQAEEVFSYAENRSTLADSVSFELTVVLLSELGSRGIYMAIQRWWKLGQSLEIL